MTGPRPIAAARPRGRPPLLGTVRQDEIRLAYQAGVRALELASNYGVSTLTIHKVLRRARIPRTPRQVVKQLGEGIRSDLMAGMTTKQLEDKYRLSPALVKAILERNDRRSRQNRVSREDAERICSAYTAGAKVKDLAAQHGLKTGVIYRLLGEAGVTRKQGTRPGKQGPKDPARARQIAEDYANGVSIAMIAAKHGVCRQRIHSILDYLGVPKRASPGKTARASAKTE